ncbi:MAG: hypothetical protein PWQ57_1081 [Desulfovibrionales bacterium]|jgi:Spy/CpxP family protein refolding chaperone|nr:hypothetical protein [Desulfovibrionales bacterium]
MSSTLKGAVGVALIFILGAITGAVVTDHFERPRIGPGDPQAMERQMRESMVRDLQITDEQLPAFNDIMDEKQVFFLGIIRETAPRVDAGMQKINRKLYEIFTPEQRARFEEMEKRRREDMRKMSESGRNKTGERRAPQ